MRIQHNIAAINSHRNLGGNNDAVSKNLEKLSSGFRINKAGDDAAGLAISEKMRAQIKGLETAQKNAQDGISLVQTAEGNLTEVHSMLNRMVELATQSANGTYDNTTDRANLQKEVESLKKEIDRISESANYNGIKLLDGSLSSGSSSSAASVADGGKVAYVAGDGVTVSVNAAEKATFSASADVTVADGKSLKVTYQDKDGKVQVREIHNNSGATASMSDLINNDDVLSKMFAATDDKTIESREAGSNGPKILSVEKDGTAVQSASIAGKDASVSFTGATTAGSTITIGDKTYEFVASGSAGTAQRGNVEVLGEDFNALVAALKKNGVQSASINANGDLEITNLDEIAVASKGIGVSVDANSGAVTAAPATKNQYATASFASAGTDNKTQTLTMKYIDEEGNSKTLTVGYNSSSTAADNQSAIINALNTNEDFNKHFKIDTTTGAITSTQAGTKGAQITAFETTDDAAGIDKKFDFTRTEVAQDASKTLEMKEIGAGTTVTVDGKTYEFVSEGGTASNGNTAIELGDNLNDSTKNLATALQKDGVQLQLNDNKIVFSNEGRVTADGNNGLVLQVGETNEDYQKVTVSVDKMDSKSLGIADINIGDQVPAGEAIDKIKAAINKVSSTRGDLGAIQNRLEHTINNLGVTTENMTAAESRIRDVDMAKEMMDFTKNNILTQAAQAMLAQANQVPQGVLQLLR